MGLAKLWEAHAVPRLIKLACGSPQFMKLRSKIVPLSRDEVFELGCGGAAVREKGWEADIRNDGVSV